ncbi:MAG: hypothetical protein KF812_01220 [Fimbriimonadaceae bacterium]|nr:hypothetical protein [Fimbriimonadaceae bacterium]
MPESGTKLSGIAAWAEAWRASDSATIAELGEQLASAPDPDEVRRMALKWASSDARSERFLGRTLLQNLADDAGDEDEQRLRSLVPWHVALNAGIVPTAQSGDFIVCLAAQQLSNVGFSLLMAHSRCPVQIVDVSENQFWTAFASLYISVVPAPLRDQLIAFGVAVPQDETTPALFPQTPAADSPAESGEAESIERGQEEADSTFVQTVWEARDKPIVVEDENDTESAVSSDEIGADFEGDPESTATEDEEGFAEAVEDEPTIPLWNRFSIEEMRTLRACPIGESADGVEFLVAAPAESTALARLSELVGGEARIRVVGLEIVNDAWREQFGEDMVAQQIIAQLEETEALTSIEIADDEEDISSLLEEISQELESEDDEEIDDQLVEEVETAMTAQEEPLKSEPESEFEPIETPSGPDPAAVALVPSGLAWFARACPYRLEGDTLVCWVQEPYDETLLSAIERRSGHSLVVEPMPTPEVMEALHQAYGQELAGVIEPLMPRAVAPAKQEEPTTDASPEIEDQTGAISSVESQVDTEKASEDEQVVESEVSKFDQDPSGLDDLVESVDSVTLTEEDFEPEAEGDFDNSSESAPAIVFAEPTPEVEIAGTPKSSLDQLLDDLDLDPPKPPIETEWRPKLSAPEPEFLTEDFQQPESPAEEVVPSPEIEAEQPAAESVSEDATEIEAEVPEIVEPEPEPIVSVQPDLPKAEPPNPNDPFTTVATDEARRAWDEFMATNGNKANRAEAQVDAVMGRLNREIALDEVAAKAVEGSNSDDEDPNDDSPVSQEETAWSTEDVEEARIGQRHADSVQRLMGHSTLPGPEILQKVSREMAIQNQIVPITIEEGTLHLIGSQPIAPIDVRELSNEIGMPLQLHLGTPEAVNRLITKAYPETSGEETVVHQMRLEEGRKQEEAAQQSWLDKLMNRVNKSG